MKVEDINSEKISDFMLTLNYTEIIYLTKLMEIRGQLASLQRDYKQTAEQMAKGLNITQRQYLVYKQGAGKFDLMFMAKMNALYVKLSAEAAKETVPIQIPKG